MRKHYVYDDKDVIYIVASYENCRLHGVAEERIVELPSDMDEIDLDLGQWKHTENGPELVS